MDTSFGINPCREIILSPPQLTTLGMPNHAIIDEAIVDGERWVTVAVFGSQLFWFSTQDKSTYHIHANSAMWATLVDMHEKLYIMYVLAWALNDKDYHA